MTEKLKKGYYDENWNFDGIRLPKSMPYVDENGKIKGRIAIADFHFVDDNGVIHTLYKGERFNGASVPWFLRFIPAIGKRYETLALASSSIHDAETRRASLLITERERVKAQEKADRTYKEGIKHSRSLLPKKERKKLRYKIMPYLHRAGVGIGSWLRSRAKR